MKAFIFCDHEIEGLDAALRECGFSESVRYGADTPISVESGIGAVRSKKPKLVLVFLDKAGRYHGTSIISDITRHAKIIIAIANSSKPGGIQIDWGMAANSGANSVIADNDIESLPTVYQGACATATQAARPIDEGGDSKTTQLGSS